MRGYSLARVVSKECGQLTSNTQCARQMDRVHGAQTHPWQQSASLVQHVPREWYLEGDAEHNEAHCPDVRCIESSSF